MKKIFIIILPILALFSCNEKIEVTSDYMIVKDGYEFSSKLTLLYAEDAPMLKMRPSGIENVKYNVATWKAVTVKDLLKQVKRDDAQQGDGFDDRILSTSTNDRTANLFNAALNIELVPKQAVEKGDTTIIQYPSNEYADISAKVFLEDGKICFKMNMKPMKDGFFSVAFLNAPAKDITATQEIWQPMIWQEMRFPDQPYMTLAYRAPIPSALATFNNTTYGVIAHPDEFPFNPLPLYNNSRFGIAVRNDKGQAQAMLFAPVLGGIDSKRKAGEAYSFTSILYAKEGSCTDSYETIARELFGFGDYRKNDISTLNNTFENVVDYALSDYSWFIDSLKGCAYSTDVPGAVKNVSSLNPLELAIVTDNSEMFEKRAYPTIEYQISREKFLFCLDREQKIQHPSRKLLGPIAPISELTSLYNIFGQNMPFLLELAEEAYGVAKVRNLDVEESGSSWMNSMFMYKATGDKKYLDKAIKDADQYLEDRVNKLQTDFSDPLAGGLFFWTGYTSRWIYLLELYELTQEQRYLDAALDGARRYTMFTWMSPKIPADSVLVNKGGKAPLYWYLRSKGHKQMYAEEENAPAWRLSEIGLTPESSGTCTGHRAIFMAHYAPWMLRLGYYAQDDFLKEVAKAAIIGRYSNFPGYHINTERTTIYEKEDYPLRPHKDLSVNSFHYNHIMPKASLLLDYLVTDAFVKSEAQISFPSDFIEGYAYLQDKFYGHKAGIWHGEEAWLWMPNKLVKSGSVELNYIAARNNDKLFIALSNQSTQEVKTWVEINQNHVMIGDEATVHQLNHKELNFENGRFEVTVPGQGQVSLRVNNVKAKVKIQQQLLNNTAGWSNDFIKVDVGNTRAMVINPGGLSTNLYLYLEDDDDAYSKVSLVIKQKGVEEHYSDDSYPFEFTVPLVGDEVQFKVVAMGVSGKKQESEWKKLNK